MSTTVFEKNIKTLAFSFKKESDPGGVLLTENYTQLNDISPQELFALETAKEKFEADAVYFRYFQDGRGAVQQIYIYDNTEQLLSEKNKRDIHIKVWSGCQVPMFIIIEKTEAIVFDARKRLENDNENFAFETIQLFGEAIHKFSAASFDDGMFWEEERNKDSFQFSTSAYKTLVDGLLKVYEDFQKKSGLNSHLVLKLLLQCLLIKYLEERDNERGYFSAKYFLNKFECKNFCSVIRAGKLLDLLDVLGEDFNGKIFEWNKIDEIEERKLLQEPIVQSLAEYLDGKVDEKGQINIWRRYSFKSLPVELISSVYETLLTDSKDIVYTPEMIVSTLVDECMPLKKPQQNFKVIDVSCGSGIFLVKVYKRIIQWWRYEQWKATGELKKPSLKVLKQLLTESIYGVDIEGDAIRLTVFSLALAMLDEVDLDPPNWEKLRFPDLSKANIRNRDFFEYITDYPPNDFNLVIGNPPFNLQSFDGKEIKREPHFKKLEKEYGYKSEIKIPDNNPALHFLVQALKLLKTDAILCLIQPSGPLLYQKDENFKKAVFGKNKVLQILDFTKLDDVLWGERTVATAAIFLQKCLPDKEDLVHIIADRTFANLNKLFLELDHYNFHIVGKVDAMNNANVWKANLVGGGRLGNLINRLSKFETLGDFLKKKKRENNWIFGDGFIKGKPDELLVATDFDKKKGGYSSAPYLKGSECFNPEDFTENGIRQTYTLDDTFYQWKRQPELFQPPLLLIKKNMGVESIPIIYFDKAIAFKNEVIGIHAPAEDFPLLKKIENFIKDNQVLRFYVFLISSRSGISRSTSTLLQKDIFNIPFENNDIPLKTSAAEKILINDVLQYQLNNGEKELNKNTSDPQIKTFSKTFCQTLNSVYKADGKEFKLFKILDAGKYFALHFRYTDELFTTITELTENLEKSIQEIIPTQKKKGKSSHTQRILKVYGKDTIIISKPKQLRYWLQSIAFRDADETFAAYIKTRYS